MYMLHTVVVYAITVFILEKLIFRSVIILEEVHERQNTDLISQDTLFLRKGRWIKVTEKSTCWKIFE